MVEAITRHAPAPKPNRRRKDDASGGFRRTIAKIVRRIPRAKPPPATDATEPLWNALDWLQQWADCDAAAPVDASGDPDRPDHSHDPPDFSPGV